MKEKFKKWITFNMVFAVIYTITAIYMFCISIWIIGLLCIGIAICSLSLHLKDGKCKELYKLAKECNDNEKKAIETTKWAYDELQLEMQRHRLTAIQGMKYKNKADFMQRKKSLTQYLKYSDAIDSIYEQEVKRLHEMMDEIKKKNDADKKD